MNLWWKNDLVLPLRIAPERALERLDKAVRRTWSTDGSLTVLGKVKGDCFTIYCFNPWSEADLKPDLIGESPRNRRMSAIDLTLGPTFEGRVTASEYGSLLRGSARPSFYSFFLLWLFSNTLLADLLYSWSWPPCLIAIMMLLWAICVYWLLGLYTYASSLKTVRFLRTLFAFARIAEAHEAQSRPDSRQG